MKFTTLDTLSTYRKLQGKRDAAAREAIFQAELVEPFRELVNLFGGGDGLAAFKQWGMTPDMFEGEQGAHPAATVEKLAAYDAWHKTAQALEEGWRAFSPYHERIPMQEIVYGLMVMASTGMPGESSYSGFGSLPGCIMVTVLEADDYSLPRLQGATAHELHHNLFFAVRPTNFMTETTVADYMLIEGLAESFAAELYGEKVVGSFVTGFDMSRLDETKAIFRSAFDRRGFNVLRSYIFGDEITRWQGGESVGVPAFAGYALGYHTVQAYIRRTGKSVVEATFVPTAELIAESGFFAE